MYINPPSQYLRHHYRHHCNQQVKYGSDDVSAFSLQTKPPLPHASGLLTSSYKRLFASTLSMFSPKWASSAVIVGTCKCPVPALHVENTVIGLGLCGTKHTVRLQLILSHPVSSCV